jgi:hypothetical protein
MNRKAYMRDIGAPKLTLKVLRLQRALNRRAEGPKFSITDVQDRLIDAIVERPSTNEIRAVWAKIMVADREAFAHPRKSVIEAATRLRLTANIAAVWP